MNNKRLFTLVASLSLALVSAPTALVAAQRNDDVQAIAASLPVLKPEAVLTANVEVVETLAELNADYFNQVVYFLGTEAKQWETFPVPDELKAFSFQTDRLQNGNFEVSESPPDMQGGCPPTLSLFEFDRETGLFSIQEPEVYPCDEGLYWGLFFSNPPENIRVRNYETGLFGAEMGDEMSDIIRSSIENNGDYPIQIQTSDYLFVSTPIQNEGGNYLFAIYAHSDDKWSEPIPLALSGDWSFSGVTYEDGVLYFTARGDDNSIYYTLDIANKTILELFRTPYPQQIHYKASEYFYYYIGYNQSHYQFYRYDLIAQHEEVIAELPCSTITSTCTELQIKDTNWWSDIPDLMFVLEEAKTAKGLSCYVVDVTNAKLLHKGLFQADSVSFRWLDNNEPKLLITSYWNEPELKTILVDLAADHTREIISGNYSLGDISPDEKRIVIHTIDGEKKTTGIVDLETLAYTPVTLALDTSIYSTFIYWRTDSTLHISIIDLTDLFGVYENLSLRTWVIRA